MTKAKGLAMDQQTAFLYHLYQLQGKASKEVLEDAIGYPFVDVFDDVRMRLLAQGYIKKSRGRGGFIEFTAKGRDYIVGAIAEFEQRRTN